MPHQTSDGMDPQQPHSQKQGVIEGRRATAPDVKTNTHNFPAVLVSLGRRYQ